MNLNDHIQNILLEENKSEISCSNIEEISNRINDYVDGLDENLVIDLAQENKLEASKCYLKFKLQSMVMCDDDGCQSNSSDEENDVHMIDVLDKIDDLEEKIDIIINLLNNNV